MRNLDGEQWLGLILCLTGALLGLAAVMAPLPAGLAAIAVSLLGARLSRLRWIGRGAVALAFAGTAAGLIAAAVITVSP